MSTEHNVPKINPADQTQPVNGQKPRPHDELSTDELDQATGGLLPAVGPQK